MDEKELGEVSIFEQTSFDNHEQVVFCHDQSTGLKAIIGIHNTVLGPALGGTRMWNYSNEQEAIADVLRLSRGMTLKASISGLNLGGGKAVIIGDAATLKNEALLRRFGRFVESLDGLYVTAEDVNMSTKDMEYISMETKHVTGLSESIGGGGDPSPVTAYGTYMGMKACAKKVYGHESLEGRTISVQGCGNVGVNLIENLARENAKIYVSDYYNERAIEAARKYGCEVVSMDEIYDLDVDIYSPNALGATVNNDTLSRLKCSIIAGAANNQLEDEMIHGVMLKNQGITYAPDFLINAGGLINVGIDYLGGWSRERVLDKTEEIFDTTLKIFKTAEERDITPYEAALEVAEERIKAIGNIKLSM